MSNFNSKIYKLLNKDLSNLNDVELKNHYYNNGIKEKRLSNLSLPKDFSVNLYRLLNKDLNNLSDDELSVHYILNCNKEKREYKFDLPKNFDYLTYKKLNVDLSNLNKEELMHHYYKHGRYENRKYFINNKTKYKFNLPNNFDYINYKKLNPDLNHLSEDELVYHYYHNGYYENRKYSNIDDSNQYFKINYIDKILWINLLNYNVNKKNMENLLNNINIPNIRINAIDENNLDIYKLNNIKYDENLSKTELSNYLSHIKAINYLNNIDGNFFMICHDNIGLSNLKYINNDLHNIIIDSPSFDILIINKHNINLIEKYTKWDNSLINQTYDIISSYIISRNGINKLSKFAYHMNNDFIFNDLFLHTFFLFNILDTYIYKFNIVNINNNNYSSLNIDELNYIIDNS